MKYTGERVVPDAPDARENLYLHLGLHAKVATIIDEFLEDNEDFNVYKRPHLLDVGCGCGYGTAFLSHQTMGWAKGLDSCEEAIEYARRNYAAAGVTFDVQDVLMSLPGRFDIVTCIEMFEHVEHPYALAEELIECTGSLLVVVTPNGDTMPYKPDKPEDRVGFHIRHYTREDLMGFFPGAKIEVYLEEYFVTWRRR